MGKFLRNLTLVLLPVITLALGVQLGMQYERNQLQEEYAQMEMILSGDTGSGKLVTDPEEEVDITLLWSVWRLLAKHYISAEKLVTETMLYGAVSGLVDSLDDQYTPFMLPKENKEVKQALTGRLQGIGADMT